MRLVMILIATVLIAACGADGEPVQPTARTNVYITSGGVSVGTNLGLSQGPVSVNLGLGL